MKKLYQDLVDLPGAPSFEKPVRDYMRTFMKRYTESIQTDKLGSIFARIGTQDGPKVMIAGHMDEVGAMVVGFTKEGLIKMTNLGGMSGDTYVATHMNIHTDDGRVIPGVTASKPPHLSRGDASSPAALKFTDLLLDIGASSEQHAQELGVKLGQQIVSANQYTESADGLKIFSKAWDNRFGAGMALDLLEDLAEESLPCNLYLGATVQEEVGLRGAATATAMIDPDIFIAVDASPCADVFGGSDVEGRLGEGFLVRIYDPNALMHQGIKKHIVTLAEEHRIKHQYFTSKGGTDAARAQLHGDGVIVATIGMPARYIHSSTSMIHKDDYAAVKAMLIALIRSLDHAAYEKIKASV